MIPRRLPPRRWAIALLPAVLGAGWILCLLGPLLSPGRALANRDIAVFHLPLRATFRELAAFGLPVWNPWLHSGQPILSNPSYGAFYPPSWLIFLAPPTYALSLMAMLHAAIAFAGAWRLARHFGGDRGTASLAGIGYVGCGAYLSLLSAFNLFCSMVWLPWLVAWGDEALQMPAGRRWWRPALLAGGALGLQLLSGEPTPVLMSGLILLALAASVVRRRPAAALRILVPVLFATALAAVQLLPTLSRLAESPRRALPADVATVWSMPPARVAEMVFPRLYGDPARDVEGFFFGWNLHDRDYPYVESLYPGLLLTVLGISALLLWPIPRRAAWACAFAAGCLLALGRHNPVYGALRKAIPALAVIRFPEKFIILAVLSLALAGVLGWQRLLDERDAGRPQRADFPLAVALVALAAALALTAVLYAAPRVGNWFIAAHGNPILSPARREAALAYWRNEGWAAAATAAAVAALLFLCRWRRPPRRLLHALALLLLSADLWHYGLGLVRTLPAGVYRHPPPLAAALQPARDRIFVQFAQGAPQWNRGWKDPRTLHAGASLAALEPYSGLLWHIPYAFEADFDLTLTEWAQAADRILWAETARPRRFYRYLGLWNVGVLYLRKSLEEQLRAAHDPEVKPLRVVANPAVLPRFRFVPRVSFHPSYASALAAARAVDWQTDLAEQCVRPGSRPATAVFRQPPRLLAVSDRGGHIDLRYQAAQPGGFLVAAMTYDRGWRATVDGKPIAVYPTAACQLGVALPAGEHRLALDFREPLVGLGAAVSLSALAAGMLLLWLGRRRS